MERVVRWSPWPVFVLILSYFLMFGISFGTQGVMWNRVIERLALSKGVFGTVQLSGPLISVIILSMAGVLTQRLGAQRMALIGCSCIAISNFGLAFASNLAMLVPAMLIAGGGFALVEIAANAATLDWEQVTGHKVMNLMHAGFSGGAIIGSLLGGALLSAGLEYPQVFMLVGGLWAVVTLITPLIHYPTVEAHPDSAQNSNVFRLLFSRPAFVLLAIICAISTLGESVANTWSVIYLNELGASTMLASVVFAMFNITMFIGRLANSAVVARLGERSSLLISGGLMLMAGLLLFGIPNIQAAFVAFALLGLAVAGVVPTVLSAAAQIEPSNSGAITGAMMTAAYGSFIVTPPAMGWMAEALDLRTAMLLVVVTGVLALELARRLNLPESRSGLA